MTYTTSLTARDDVALRQKLDDALAENADLKKALGRDYDRLEAEKFWRRWRLTGRQAQLLAALYAAKGRCVTKDSLLTALYSDRPDADEPEIKIIDVFICKIRARLGAEVIETVWGRGYRLSEEGTRLLDEVAAMDIREIQEAPAAGIQPRMTNRWVLEALTAEPLPASRVVQRVAEIGHDAKLATVVSCLRRLEENGLASSVLRLIAGHRQVKFWSVTPAGAAMLAWWSAAG